jgi:hypothetical protein
VGAWVGTAAWAGVGRHMWTYADDSPNPMQPPLPRPHNVRPFQHRATGDQARSHASHFDADGLDARVASCIRVLPHRAVLAPPPSCACTEGASVGGQVKGASKIQRAGRFALAQNCKRLDPPPPQKNCQARAEFNSPLAIERVVVVAARDRDCSCSSDRGGCSSSPMWGESSHSSPCKPNFFLLSIACTLRVTFPVALAA